MEQLMDEIKKMHGDADDEKDSAEEAKSTDSDDRTSIIYNSEQLFIFLFIF